MTHYTGEHPATAMKTMYILLLLVLVSSTLAPGCAQRKSRLQPPPPLSIQQRAAMQTKELEGDFDTGFAATISVLQDEGWQIEVVDKASGIIQAVSLKHQDIIGPNQDWYAEKDAGYRDDIRKESKDSKVPLSEWNRWEGLTCHIEPWGENRIRQRITITAFGSLPVNTISYAEKKKDKQNIVTAGGKEQSRIVEDPSRYQYLFQQIQRAIFIRQGLKSYR
jgi:hypothetical protein